MRFHILIPVHNNRDITLRCLKLLSKQEFRDFTVTVTDDGSTDGTYEAICEQFPEITVLRGDGNLWWTGAMNLGLRHVVPNAAQEDYILTLNHDVIFGTDYLQTLAEAASLRPHSLIGSVSLDKDNPRHVVHAGVYFDWRTGEEIKGNYRPGTYFNDHINRLPGRGTLIPVRVFRRVGLYNGRKLPHYAADYELSIRARCAGFPLCVYYGAVLYSDTAISGNAFTPCMTVSLTQALQLILSNKSKVQLKTRINFVRLCCPQEYFFRNLLLAVSVIPLVLTSIKPLGYLKLIFRPIAKRYWRWV